MVNRFFEQPILNSPYEYPASHWELDDQGQPTQQVIEHRRRADFITPIPKPRKRKAPKGQGQMVIDEGMGLSTQEQQYEITANLNEIRRHVDQWRELPNPNDWRVTPKPPAFSSTGGATTSATSDPSFARWRRSRRSSG